MFDGMWGKGKPYFLLMGLQVLQSLRKSMYRILKNLKAVQLDVRLPCYIPSLDIICAVSLYIDLVR